MDSGSVLISSPVRMDLEYEVGEVIRQFVLDRKRQEHQNSREGVFLSGTSVTHVGINDSSQKTTT